jgi:hypothetical protein
MLLKFLLLLSFVMVELLSPVAQAQTPTSPQTATIPGLPPFYLYTNLNQELAASPERQALAREAQRTGINNPNHCKPGRLDDTYKYQVNSGTDPKGYYYNPMCPQGVMLTLWFDPKDGPKFNTVGSTDTWRAPKLECHYETGFSGSSPYEFHYSRVRVCDFKCPIVLHINPHPNTTFVDTWVEYTDPRVANNPDYAAQVSRCKAQVEGRPAATNPTSQR